MRQLTLGQLLNKFSSPRLRARVTRVSLLTVLIVGVLGSVVGTTTAEPPTRPRYGITDSLVAYWKLEEASGTRLDELNGCGGSGCDLTDNNTVTQNTGILGNAAQFTAVNHEYLSHIDHADLSVGDIDFTISAWVYADTLPITYPSPINQWGAAGNRSFYLGLNANQKLYFDVSSDGTTSSQVVTYTSAIGSGSWVLVIVWHDGAADTLNIQINNGSVVSNNLTTGVFDSTASWQIGAGGYWDGRIDSVGFWKRVLSSTERTCLYNSGAGVEYPFTACDPTPTPTPTDTFTPTVTSTPTDTATFTPTVTDTPTITNTPTVTDTPTATDTFTPTVTDTPTDTATPTATGTPTVTRTPTLTPTPRAPVTSSVCADSFTFPLDTGDVFTVDLCANVGDLVIGGTAIAILVLLGLYWLWREVTRGVSGMP